MAKRYCGKKQCKNLKDTFMSCSYHHYCAGFIGMGTLLAGIIGVKQYYGYVCKRKELKEIGVKRKQWALKPKSIIALIIQESIVVR